jgi:hypothetical protein
MGIAFGSSYREESEQRAREFDGEGKVRPFHREDICAPTTSPRSIDEERIAQRTADLVVERLVKRLKLKAKT